MILRFLLFAAVVSLAAALACSGSYFVYVSNERSGDVSIIDGATLTVVGTIEVGKRPRGIHLAQDGKTLLVATSGSPRMGPGVDRERAMDVKADKSADGVAVIDIEAGKVSRHLKVGSDPEEFAVTLDGRRILVANEDIARASLWDLETGRRVAETKVTEEPEGVAMHPNGRIAYVTCEEEGDIYVLDTMTGKAVTHFRLGGRPRTVAFSNDGSRAFIPLETASSIALVDAQSHRVLRKIPVAPPALPMGSAISPDGREVYVSTGRGNTVVVLDTTSLEIVATIAVGTRPWGVALSPDGKRLFTANGPSGDVSVIDVQQRKEIARINAGQGPWGVAIGPRVEINAGTTSR